MNIENNIHSVREKLLSHEIYACIRTIEELRVFMSSHVFAVWDFMSLAKRLQNEMTCTKLPWQTPANARAARLINEIVLYEETDLDHNGNPASHLQMYLAAMGEVGADTSMFENFMHGLSKGLPLQEALGKANVPEYVSTFVIDNIQCACAGRIEEVASSFLFAREDAIPDMFALFLEKWGVAQSQIPALVYYLKRHIDLDGDEHGPAAQKILEELVADDPAKVARATRAAILAIEDRIALWDGIVAQINTLRR